jgi:hypothetical protein
VTYNSAIAFLTSSAVETVLLAALLVIASPGWRPSSAAGLSGSRGAGDLIGRMIGDRDLDGLGFAVGSEA